MDPPCWDDHGVALCQFDFDDFIAHIAQPGTILYLVPDLDEEHKSHLRSQM